MFGFIKEKMKRVIVWSLGGLLVAGSLWAATGWKVDSYGNITGGRSSVIVEDGEAKNCALAVASTTLSVVAKDGTALSATNPCVVGVHDNSGVYHVARFVAPVTVTFGSTSNTDGNDFGLTNSVNWADIMPFFMGVVTNGTNDYFIIGRRPRVATGAAAGNICQKDDTDCDSQDDQMILTTGLTLSSWTTKSITPIAFFHATYATSGSAWTFTVTNNLSEGFNLWSSIGQRYHFSLGQNGAAANYPWSGTTPPTYATPSSIEYDYWFESIFSLCIRGTTAGAGNATNGTGTAVINLALPLAAVHATSANSWWPIGVHIATAHTPVNGTMHGLTNSQSDSNIGLYGNTLLPLESNDFSGAGDDLYWDWCYSLQ